MSGINRRHCTGMQVHIILLRAKWWVYCHSVTHCVLPAPVIRHNDDTWLSQPHSVIMCKGHSSGNLYLWSSAYTCGYVPPGLSQVRQHITGYVYVIVMLAQMILELVLGKHLGHGYLTRCGRIAWGTILYGQIVHVCIYTIWPDKYGQIAWGWLYTIWVVADKQPMFAYVLPNSV